MRIVRFTAVIRGYRGRRITLVTSLLDPKLYPAEQLIGLYARRWRLELCLRDLKTTMVMEQLRCQSPDLVEKELLMYLIGHNVIRCLMAEGWPGIKSIWSVSASGAPWMPRGSSPPPAPDPAAA